MEEQVYHVDAKDNILAKVDQSKAHNDKLLHRAGVVLIFNQSKELFIKTRGPKNKFFSNCFDSACSFHVKCGQTYEEAAKQALLKETGIARNPKYIGKVVSDEDPDHMIIAVYMLFFDGEIKLDPIETTGGKFYPLNEAHEILEKQKTTPWLKQGFYFYKRSS